MIPAEKSAGYENAIRDALPDARVCFDPFHVVKLAYDVRHQAGAANGEKSLKSRVARQIHAGEPDRPGAAVARTSRVRLA